MDGFIFVGTNFRGLKKNQIFMGFNIRGHSLSFIIHTENPYLSLEYVGGSHPQYMTLG